MWLSDNRDPELRSVRPARAAGGSDWIRPWRNEGYTVAGINQLLSSCSQVRLVDRPPMRCSIVKAWRAMPARCKDLPHQPDVLQARHIDQAIRSTGAEV